MQASSGRGGTSGDFRRAATFKQIQNIQLQSSAMPVIRLSQSRPQSFQKHLFLEGSKRPIAASQNQAFTAHDSGRFLERLWRARQAVPTPMPSSREMTFHEAPGARRVATWRGFTAIGGSLVPSAFKGTNRSVLAPVSDRLRVEFSIPKYEGPGSPPSRP